MDFTKFLSTLSDRSSDVLPAIRDYLDGWGCDLKGRKPKVFEGKDGTTTMELDLPALIMELVKNRTVVNIPRYRVAGERIVRSNEAVLSAENRHGPVCAPSSHRQFPNLGLMIEDANVIKDGQVGAPRTYNFCGTDGMFRDDDAWHCIELFGADGSLADEITLTCTVNPGRWASIYGRPYLAAKAAVLRLKDESKHYDAAVRSLRKKFPKDKAPYFASKDDGPVVEVELTAFEAELDGFELAGKYPTVGDTLEDLEKAEKHLSSMRALIKRLNFPIRVSEAAFTKHGLGGADPIAWCNGSADADLSAPVWANDAAWETGYKPSARHKNLWARRDMPMGFQLRFRAWKQKAKLAAEEAQRILNQQAA